MSDEELITALKWRECASTDGVWCDTHGSNFSGMEHCAEMVDRLDHAEQGMELVSPILTDLIAELRAENEWHFTAMANRAEARLSEVSPTTTVALGTQSTIDIIESTSNTLDPDLAEQIRQAWLTETGRRCILLAGFRYAGTVEVQGE